MPDTGFFSLPAELRLKIYYHMIPRSQALEFSISLGSRPPCLERHCGYSRTVSKVSLRVHPHIHWYRYYHKDWKPAPKIAIQLLRVCRQMYEEVASILYGENTFRFHVGPHGRPSSTPFKPLEGFSSNEALRFLPDDAIRRLTQCEIIIQANMQLTAKAWLAKFVSRFGNGQRLKRLLVAFFAIRDVCYIHHHPSGQFQPLPPLLESKTEKQELLDSISANSRFQYSLEPLVALAPVEKVEVVGHVSDTFREQLLSILSKSAPPAKLRRVEYPERVLLRKRTGKKRRTWLRVKRKAATDPDYDWHALNGENHRCAYYHEHGQY